MSYKGKIYYCTNYDLGISNKSLSDGHFVLIKDLIGNNAVVRTIVSLENKYGFNIKKINKVKSGRLFYIPKKYSNLPRLSAISNEDIIVDFNRLVKTNKKINSKLLVEFFNKES